MSERLLSDEQLREIIATPWPAHKFEEKAYSHNCKRCDLSRASHYVYALYFEVERLEHQLGLKNQAAEVMCNLTDKVQNENDRLTKENAQLRASVMNQCSDNLCWIEDVEAVKALPESEFLESCRRYRQQIADARGEIKSGRTIAQLEAENESLRLMLDFTTNEGVSARQRNARLRELNARRNL